MQFSRRKFLTYSSAGLVTALAGCSEDGEVSNPSEESVSTPPQSTQTPTETEARTSTETEIQTETETQTETPQQSVATLGETLTYSRGDKQLQFTIAEASLHDALLSSRSGSIYSDVPEQSNSTYLTTLIEVVNTGEGRIRTPQNIVFTFDGRQYEQNYRTFRNNRYEGYEEILPGSSTSGWLVFTIPQTESEGRFVVNFARFGDAVTGEWTLNTGNLEWERFDYTGQNIGALVTFGTGSVEYQLGATNYEETQSYTYSSGDYEFTEEPSEGNKFVLVSVYGRNSGNNPVSIPGSFDMSLRTGTTQVDTGYYSGNNAFEGGEISSGVERQGIVQFEVPESASNYEFTTNLTQDIVASWTF